MLNTEDIVKRVKETGAKRIFLQVPEGLKTGVLELSESLDRQGIRVFVSVERCYGACDLRDHEALLLGCDLLLHIGHSDLGIKTEVPVLYYEYSLPLDIAPLLEKNLGKLKKLPPRVGLLTTIQFINYLPEARKFLEKHGKKTIQAGHILGCDHSAAREAESRVDCFLFIGSGRFHPLGILKATEKPVFFLDIEKRALHDLSPEREKEKIKSILRMEKARSLRRFGILVSMKKGQLHMRDALETKHALEKMGKKAFILTADEFTPDKLLGLDLDCLVNTACPRLADDSELFRKPILTKEEAETL